MDSSRGFDESERATALSEVLPARPPGVCRAATRDYEGRTSTEIRAGGPDRELFRDGWNENPHAEVTR
jgi:hypothetical protein